MTTQTDLTAAIADLRDQLAKLPPAAIGGTRNSRARRHHNREQALTALVHHIRRTYPGARYRVGMGQPDRLVLMGVSASHWSGPAETVRHWLAKAEWLAGRSKGGE